MAATLPMPGDALGPDIVIASCWDVDEAGHDAETAGEDGLYRATVLVLHSEPEYYSVLGITCEADSEDDWQRDWGNTFPNIIPAAEYYSEMIGGY